MHKTRVNARKTKKNMKHIVKMKNKKAVGIEQYTILILIILLALLIAFLIITRESNDIMSFYIDKIFS